MVQFLIVVHTLVSLLLIGVILMQSGQGGLNAMMGGAANSMLGSSGANDFIMKLEHGYQTYLINNGDNLSGGQRYRVDMARALLSDAPILILDEPTSALDYENKTYFIDNLKTIKADTRKIILVITHDFSIMPIFDSIVLMNDGELASQSNHNDLLENNEWYRDGFQNSNGGKIES